MRMSLVPEFVPYDPNKHNIEGWMLFALPKGKRLIVERITPEIPLEEIPWLNPGFKDTSKRSTGVWDENGTPLLSDSNIRSSSPHNILNYFPQYEIFDIILIDTRCYGRDSFGEDMFVTSEARYYSYVIIDHPMYNYFLRDSVVHLDENKKILFLNTFQTVVDNIFKRNRIVLANDVCTREKSMVAIRPFLHSKYQTILTHRTIKSENLEETKKYLKNDLHHYLTFNMSNPPSFPSKDDFDISYLAVYPGIPDDSIQDQFILLNN